MEREDKVGTILVSTVLIYWGFTIVLMKHALLYMNSVTYIMLCFLSAAIVIGLILGKRLYRNISKRLILHGFVLGMLLIIPMECTTVAMYYTSASNSIFIGQLTFVFVPMLECIFQNKWPTKRLWLTVLGLLLGLVIFSNVLETGLNVGDMISIISAFFNSVSIMALKKYAETEEPLLLGALQVLFAAMFSTGVWIVIPGTVVWCVRSFAILFFTGIIGSAVAFILASIGQARISSTNTAFLHLLEPVFAMVGAYYIKDEFGHFEEITHYKIVGAIIIIGTLIVYLRGTISPSGKKE